MSDYYRSEEEQIELVKQWWKKYGLVVIIGVIVAIALVVGWRYYKHYEFHKSSAASLIYSQMQQIAHHDAKQAQAKAQTLIKQYSSTPYATLASLWLAKESVSKNDLKTAAKHLQWVMRHERKGEWHDLAAVRLARIYLAQKQPQKALDLLNKLPKNSFYIALILQARGDVYADLNRDAQAVKAYQLALRQLPYNSLDYLTVQRKLANLPVQKSS